MKKNLILSAFILLGFAIQAQVGINTLTPDTTAILHVYSDNKGVLLPVLNNSNRSSLGQAPAAEGLLVYDSIDKVYYFFNRATKEWLAMNPFQTLENSSGNSSEGDVRLAEKFKGRNVVIGDGNAPIDAKLHVIGNIRSTQTVYAENADINSNIESSSLNTNTATINTAQITTANITDVTQSKTILADSIQTSILRSNLVYGAVPVGAIVMWDSIAPPPCWEPVDGMNGRFPVGVSQQSGGQYGVRATIDNTGKSGMNQVALTINQMPRHQHRFRSVRINDEVSGSSWAHTPGSYNEVRDGVINEKYTDFRGNSTHGDNEGDGQPHENRPPFYGVYFIRKTSNNCPN